jgi:hypothetical protein
MIPGIRIHDSNNKMASNNSKIVVRGVENHTPRSIEDLNKPTNRSRNPTLNEKRALQARKESESKRLHLCFKLRKGCGGLEKLRRAVEQ